MWISWTPPLMENSSTSKSRRHSLVPARFKGQQTDIFIGHNHLAEARAQDGRRHEFSLDSLDKEILQTMSRGSKNTQVSLPRDSASESSGSTQEKVMCSREIPHPEPVPYTIPSGVHSMIESTPKSSKKPSEQHHGASNIGQFHPPLIPTRPAADARSNGYKQQVSVNVNADKHDQDPGHWHHSGGTLHPSGGNNELLHVFQLKGPSYRDVHPLNTRLDAVRSSDTSGEDTVREEVKKQASEGPYSGSVSMFAYPGTSQRVFPGGQRNDAECPNVGDVSTGSPADERATKTNCGGQYSGGRSQQKSATKTKVPKAPPSKWDDAGKWIASPGHIEFATTQSARSNQGLVPSSLALPGMRSAVAGQLMLDECNEHDCPSLAAPTVDPSFSLNDNGNTSSDNGNNTSSVIGNSTSSVNGNSTSSVNGNSTSSVNGNSTSSVNGNSTSSFSGNTSSPNESTSSVRVKDHIKQIESAIQISQAKSPSSTDVPKRREASRAKCAGETRDTSVIASTVFVQRPKDSRLDGLISPPKLLVEPQAAPTPVSILRAENPPPAAVTAPTAIKDIFSNDHSHSRPKSDFPSSKSSRERGTATAQETSSIYRDMGTQMTPNPSGRLSRGATPRTYNISPSRQNPLDHHSRRNASLEAPANADIIDLQGFHVEKLGRSNQRSEPRPILDRNSNWSTREEEEEECATHLRTQDYGETQTSPYVTWAAAWEEAECAKYTAKFHQEEARIQAWEELQKAKAETQMRKTEVKLEKMHESASQKMTTKIAAAHRKAEDMRAAAEACRDELATKAKHRAEYIRQTGNVPTTLGCLAIRLVPFQSNLQ